MKLLRTKLPIIKSSQIVKSDEKETNFQKLSIYNKNNNLKVIKIPKKVVPKNYNDYLSHRESISQFETTHEKNESIKSFLFKNISVNYNLSPKFNLKKLSSTNNFRKIQKVYSNDESETKFNRNSINKTNDMNLFLLKLDKMFGIKSDLRRINDISKELYKDNENPTNGNKLYNDTEEEKKESFTYFIDKNNMKNILKKNLTRKINIKRNILKMKQKDSDDFKIKSTSFIPFGYNNIRKLKYFENMIHEKINNNNNTLQEKNDYFKIESKKEKFKSVLRKKMRNLGIEMKNNKNYMKNINQRIDNCLLNARNKLENFAKTIEKDYSN